MRITAALGPAICFTLATGCAQLGTRKDRERLVAANPRSIVIVPVMNKSVDVDAPDYFLSTLAVPLAERGYYVFPVNAVKRLLEDDGLADPGVVHRADPARLGALFGADAILYVTIEKWTAKYLVVSTKVEVEFEYVLKDGRDGAELWRHRERMDYVASSGDSLIVALVSAALTKASPNYMPLARKANDTAFAWPGPGLPAGPYRPEHGKDFSE